MSNLDIKQKLNDAFVNLSESLEKLNIESEIEIDEESGMNVISFATYVKQLTSYPVVIRSMAEIDEDETCTLIGHVMLSFNLNVDKITEIRRVVNEWNKQMVLGTITINPEDYSMHYNYKGIINNVEGKTEQDLVREISEKLDRIISMAAQLLSIIEKNDYEADMLYDDNEDEDSDLDFDDELDELDELLENNEE